MAKRSKSYWRAVYREALEFMGVTTKKGWSLKYMKKVWSDVRQKELADNTELPAVQTVAKTARIKKQKEFEYEETPRDEEMNTLPADEPLQLGKQYIDNFLQTIDHIYEDTKAYIASAPLNSKGNIRDPEFYFLDRDIDEMESSYQEIKKIIDVMRSQFGDEIVAQAIASNVEIYYIQALVFIPPSGTINNFAVTVEQLTAIMIDISSRMTG